MNNRLKASSFRIPAAVSLPLFAVLLVILLLNVHPGESLSGTSAAAKANVLSGVELSSEEIRSDAVNTLGGETVLRKHYTIPETASGAPAPDPSCYGTLDIADADQMEEIILRAEESGLLEGQEVIFDPEANFYHNSVIEYYYDETILMISWKELINNCVTSCCEVKIADASQFRRKLAGDTYGSSVNSYCSQLAAGANAVVAMNADFYAFREFGVCVYDRTLYRFNPYYYSDGYRYYNVLDNLFIKSDGDFLFYRRGTVNTADELQQYINDKDVLFSLAFGPILVEDGTVHYTESYPCGEINRNYSRAGIGQVDHLHYLYMTVSHSGEGTQVCDMYAFAQIFASKNVRNAYGLDGGQTAELCIRGSAFNLVDFGFERAVSDIIYFASALPEEGNS